MLECAGSARRRAFKATQEAVQIRRRWHKTATQTPFVPDLAMSLNNLGGRLSELGRREDALEATRESVRLYTDLFQAYPQAFLQNFMIAIRTHLERLTENQLDPDADPEAEAAFQALQASGLVNPEPDRE